MFAEIRFSWLLSPGISATDEFVICVTAHGPGFLILPASIVHFKSSKGFLDQIIHHGPCLLQRLHGYAFKVYDTGTCNCLLPHPYGLSSSDLREERESFILPFGHFPQSGPYLLYFNEIEMEKESEAYGNVPWKVFWIDLWNIFGVWECWWEAWGGIK